MQVRFATLFRDNYSGDDYGKSRCGEQGLMQTGDMSEESVGKESVRNMHAQFAACFVDIRYQVVMQRHYYFFL